MKYTVTTILAIAVAALITSAATFATDIKQIDRRPEGHAGTGYVIFATNAGGDGVSAFSFIGLVRGEQLDASHLDAAFGMWAPETGSTTSTIPVDQADGLLAAATDALAVQVDADQYGQVEELYADWSVKESDLPPDIACLNFTVRVVRGLELKAPYQSGLAPPSATGYYKDLTILNRPRK